MVKSILLKTVFYLLFVSLIYTGCNDASTTGQSGSADSVKKDTALPVGKSSVDPQEYDEAEEMKKLVRDFSQICEHPVTKDTMFIIGGDSISVAFNHSCTGDSFPLPAKYLEMYKLDHFMAHSLKSEVVVEKNGIRIADKKITKKDFDDLIDPSLKQYAVLLYPNIGTKNDTIYIHYSISIPLTDIGVGVTANILKDGSIQFNSN